MLFVTDTFGGNVGLAISQSLILNGMLQHGMRLTAEVVNQMTSVERVLEYTKVEKETDLETHPGKYFNLIGPLEPQ
jgi:ATP-binding cassette subfamily C (CFTR/MRP) protein 4